MNLCLCGCGLSTSPGSQYRHGHWAKANRQRLSAMWHRAARSDHGDGYITVRVDGSGKSKLEHVAIAERALGRPLPKGVVVHHIDENRSHNVGANLVICPDAKYHRLLHQRMRARAASGNANWRLCTHCGQYDAPENLYIPPTRGTILHPKCKRTYYLAHRRKQ